MSSYPTERRVRSFVLRTGRMTISQERALEKHSSRWILDHSNQTLDINHSFGRSGIRVLEIGFGMGDSLLQMAKAAPDSNFIGVEVHSPGVGCLFHNMEEECVSNIRVYCHDAVEVLRDCIADDALDIIQIYFPDPWHKTRHRKRRLIQSPFVELLVRKLKVGGLLHLATDWEDYAHQMLTVLSASKQLHNVHGAQQYTARPERRPLTKFERRGERLGHGVWDLEFTRS